MKNTKKIIFGFLLILFMGITINVKAGLPPYVWVVDGKDITENTDTVSVVREGTVSILKLNNYKGKGIALECRGTGVKDMQFIIELTGENIITDDNIGIDLGEIYSGNLKFTGDGTLRINSRHPISISYQFYQNMMNIKQSSNVYIDKEGIKQEEVTEEKQEEVTTTDSDTKLIDTNENKELISPSNKKDNNNLIMYIIFGTYGVLSLIIILILAIKLSKKKKEEAI